MLAQNIHDNFNSNKINLKGIAVGNGCVGFNVEGGCGLDSLELLVTVMEQGKVISIHQAK